MLRFFERMNEGLTILGMPPRGPMLKVWTAEAGFEVIKVRPHFVTRVRPCHIC